MVLVGGFEGCGVVVVTEVDMIEGKFDPLVVMVRVLTADGGV